MTMMHEKYNAFRIFVRVGFAIVKIVDITEDDVKFDSINNHLVVDFESMTKSVNGVLNEHLEENRPYRHIMPPVGYGK